MMIDIIVPTHHVPLFRTLKLTLECIEAIYANTKEPFHLIIVDDSMDKLTPVYFKELQYVHDNITLIHSDRPYKSGNQIFNQGLTKATSDLVAIVVNSVQVQPDWETVALDLMKEDSEIGAIGFKCLFPWGLIETVGIMVDGLIPKDLGRDMPGHALTSVCPVEAVSWSFVLLRKEAIGTLNENTYHGFAGWDDIDNCFVMRKAGWKVVSCGLGAGIHYPRSTRLGDNAMSKQKQSEKNAQIFYKRWGYWKDVQKARRQAVEAFR